jgi:hypothetical protein
MVPSPVARGRISIAVQVYKRGNPALSAKGLPVSRLYGWRAGEIKEMVDGR